MASESVSSDKWLNAHYQTWSAAQEFVTESAIFAQLIYYDNLLFPRLVL